GGWSPFRSHSSGPTGAAERVARDRDHITVRRVEGPPPVRHPVADRPAARTDLVTGMVANRLTLLVVVAVVLWLTACSHAPSPSPPPRPSLSGDLTPRRLPEPLPPPAEPAPARPLVAVAAGRLVMVGSAPEGIVADAVTRTVVVGVRDPDQLTLLNADTGVVSGHVALPGVLRHLQLAAPGGPV